MEYLTVSIYIECFARTCLKKTPSGRSHLLSYVLYICLNEETIGGLNGYFF